MKKGILAIIITLIMLISIIAIPASIGATNGPPDLLMCFCLDSSGSIDEGEWNIMKQGLYNAIADETVVNRDGTVEICITRFEYIGWEVMAPTVVDDSTIAGILSTIDGMPKSSGMTNIADGIDQSVETMEKSAYFNDNSVWKAINLATDGEPNLPYTSPGDPGSPEAFAETAVQNAVSAGIDEIDVEGIGPDADNEWMAWDIAYPDGPEGDKAPIIPPDNYPPRPPDEDFMGFVRACANFEEYEDAVKQKLVLILKGQLSLAPPDATNYIGEEHCVTATLVDGEGQPVEGMDVSFTVMGANGPEGGSAVTDENGEAVFCYTGLIVGEDTIVAGCEDPEDSTKTLTSNSVAKEWIEEPLSPTPTPTPVVGGDVYPTAKLTMIVPFIALAVVILLAAGIVIRRGRVHR